MSEREQESSGADAAAVDLAGSSETPKLSHADTLRDVFEIIETGAVPHGLSPSAKMREAFEHAFKALDREPVHFCPTCGTALGEGGNDAPR